MKKRIIFALLSLILLVTTPVPVQGASTRGVDRSKIGFDSLESYPLIITVGEFLLKVRSHVGRRRQKKILKKP